MKVFIKEQFRKLIKEDVIDGQDMNPNMQSLCNTMSVKSYEEVLGRITAAIGPRNKNPKLWASIAKPLENLANANFEINNEKHTDMMGNRISTPNGMTGDSIPDEANTWWSAIQTELCEQGPDFQ